MKMKIKAFLLSLLAFAASGTSLFAEDEPSLCTEPATGTGQFLTTDEFLAFPNATRVAFAEESKSKTDYITIGESGKYQASNMRTLNPDDVCIDGKYDSGVIKRYLDAVSDGQWEYVAALMKQGFDLTRTDENGANAFHALKDCSKIDETFIIALKKAFSDIGVDGINQKTNDGVSPLGSAIGWRNPDAVRVLLKYGADPNATRTVEGKFGTIEKSLMDYAIERHNSLVEHLRNPAPGTLWMDVDSYKLRIKMAKEIVSLMAQATGTKIQDL